MKGKRIVLTCAIAAMTVSMGAMANEIYKWIDADGNVHYGAGTRQVSCRRADSARGS
jgi:hypothetical protein